jgi:hypothetical protein
MSDFKPAQEKGESHLSSISQLVGLLVPAAGLALIYLSAFTVLRPKVPSVYQPKHRRAHELRQQRSGTAHELSIGIIHSCDP